MDAETESIIKPPPVCGIASLASPILGFGIATILFSTGGTGGGGLGMDGNAILGALSILFGLIAGTVLGGVGIYREEKFPWLPRIGLLLSAIPLVAALIFAR